jgi:hypothetical protein
MFHTTMSALFKDFHHMHNDTDFHACCYVFTLTVVTIVMSHTLDQAAPDYPLEKAFK